MQAAQGGRPDEVSPDRAGGAADEEPAREAGAGTVEGLLRGQRGRRQGGGVFQRDAGRRPDREPLVEGGVLGRDAGPVGQ